MMETNMTPLHDKGGSGGPPIIQLEPTLHDHVVLHLLW